MESFHIHDYQSSTLSFALLKVLLYQEKSFWFNLGTNMTSNLMVDSLKENTSRQENNANLTWVALPFLLGNVIGRVNKMIHSVPDLSSKYCFRLKDSQFNNGQINHLIHRTASLRTHFTVVLQLVFVSFSNNLSIHFPTCLLLFP